MSCPYSDFELEVWENVCNAVGDACHSCKEWECEHNTNSDNPELVESGEYSALFQEGE